MPILLVLALLTASGATAAGLPWADAGLDEREAAAHLLDRFTYGPRPGEVDAVVEIGLEEWLDRQLAADLPEPDLARLRDLPALSMRASEIAETYPQGSVILRAAQQKGVLEKGENPRQQMKEPGVRRELLSWAEEQGYRRQGELTNALLTQKVYRAAAAENQLAEVLTDFWFNHFNVSLTDPQGRTYVLAYERDAVRPFVLGDFREMLGATARHPAMLHYLDNARSVAEEGAPTTLDQRLASIRSGRGGGRGGLSSRGGSSGRLGGASGRGAGRGQRPNDGRRPQGLNENYARELLELHTLGVDGGYTQDDVVEVARAFTGWTVLPPGPMRESAMARVAEAERYGRRIGFERDGEFIFRPDAHDAGPKEVLGVRLSPDRGIEDGEAVLDIVTRHPSTARHLAEKLAAKFVADEPPAELVDRLADTFARTSSDLGAVVRELAYSPEFWSPESRSQKIKSPFDLAISAVRGVGGEIDDAAGIVDWIGRMGQPLYRYQAPTGYPDSAEAWVNAGALLTRMNFGLALATGVVPGVIFDLPALVGHREPQSPETALAAYAKVLLPERSLDETLAQLEPVIRDPELAGRLEERDKATFPTSMETDQRVRNWENPFPGYVPDSRRLRADTSVVAQVVGVILGSPEFQRR